MGQDLFHEREEHCAGAGARIIKALVKHVEEYPYKSHELERAAVLRCLEIAREELQFKPFG